MHFSNANPKVFYILRPRFDTTCAYRSRLFISTFLALRNAPDSVRPARKGRRYLE